MTSHNMAYYYNFLPGVNPGGPGVNPWWLKNYKSLLKFV